MSDERWSGERLIAEIEGVAASWHRVLDREQVSLLRGQMLNLFRRFQQPIDARITELEQEQIALWHTINTQATYAEELEAQLAQTWQPLPDGRYGGESPDGSDDWWLRISGNGNTLEQWSASLPEKTEIGSLSFFDARLCRLVTQEPTL